MPKHDKRARRRQRLSHAKRATEGVFLVRPRADEGIRPYEVCALPLDLRKFARLLGHFVKRPYTVCITVGILHNDKHSKTSAHRTVGMRISFFRILFPYYN